MIEKYSILNYLFISFRQYIVRILLQSTIQQFYSLLLSSKTSFWIFKQLLVDSIF